MKRRQPISISPKIILAILTFICIVFLAITLFFKDSIAPLNYVAGKVFTPMQKGVNSVGRFVNDRLEYFETNSKIRKENKELKEKVNDLAINNKLLEQDQTELDTLRKLYKLDKKYADYKKVGARIIGSDNSNWYNTFTIDKGSKDGMKKDMNVIAGKGLVGIIVSVGPNYSKVRSLIDDTSKVSAMFVSTSDNCWVYGDLTNIQDGYITVERINKDAKISEGDELVTSNISPSFLPGITIGYVSDIKKDSDNLTKSAKVTPIVDFQHLEDVLVITDLKEKIDK